MATKELFARDVTDVKAALDICKKHSTKAIVCSTYTNRIGFVGVFGDKLPLLRELEPLVSGVHYVNDPYLNKDEKRFRDRLKRML